jgi:hypothetical protein
VPTRPSFGTGTFEHEGLRVDFVISRGEKLGRGNTVYGRELILILGLEGLHWSETFI